MNQHSALCSHGRRSVTACLFIFALLAQGGAARAGESDLAAPLCAAVKGVVSKTSVAHHAGARGQLVTAISEAFHHDPDKLAQVQDQIDAVTTASCPNDRDDMLAVLKMKTLAQAVR